jgi:hypothetical protein
MCRQAQKQHLQWTSRWVSNSCSLINGAKSISLYPKGVHIISFHANCLGCFYRIIHRIWEIAPQKMTCCKPPQACGWGTINCQEVGCILTTCKIFYLFNFSCYFHWLIIFFFPVILHPQRDQSIKPSVHVQLGFNFSAPTLFSTRGPPLHIYSTASSWFT